MMPANHWKGMRVAITGGTSGLGLALVHQLRLLDASVVFIARDKTRVRKVADETGAFGIAGDVGSKKDIYPTALQITGLLGGLDILVNNASSLGTVPLRPFADTECEELEAALAVNLIGPFRLTKALFGALAASAREKRGGIVVNISSDAATNAYPDWGAYSCSKAALKHMSDIWHSETCDLGMTFLSLDPGDMNTPLHMAAVPDADQAGLKHPQASAREIIAALSEVLAGDTSAEGPE